MLNVSHFTAYYDGSLLGSCVLVNNINDLNVVYIGRGYTGTPSSYFNGSIDEVQIYNRVLGPEEINASYNTGLYRLYHNFTGLSDGEYNYTAYVQDLAGNVNQTETRTLTIDTSYPSIEFVSPTDVNNAYVSRTYSYVNVTATDDNNITAFIDWNYSLVGWWRMNENSGTNIEDFSSYSNNGTMNNMNTGIDNGTSGRTEDSKFGNGLMFDGINDYVETTDAVSNNTFTLSAWIYPQAGEDFAEGIDGILEKRKDGAEWRFTVNTGYTVGFMGWHNSSEDSINFATDKTVSTNTWSHVLVTFNGTTVSIYINGLFNKSADLDSGEIIQNTISPIRMGTDGLDVDRYFNGTIDEVRIYNRVLSPEEINASYNAGLYRLYHNFTSLDEGSYTYTAYAQDLAGNVNSTTRTLTIDTTQPFIEYVSPTDENDDYVSRTYSYVNVSVSDSGSPNNLTAFIDWNNSLVGWWRFNEASGITSQDFSTYGNDGTLLSMNTGLDNGTSGWSSGGKFGNAINFDGYDSRIDCGNDVSLNLTADMTVSAWINSNNLSASLRRDVVTKGKIDSYEWALATQNNNRSQFVVFNTISSNHYDPSGSTVLVENTWYYLTGVVNGTGAYIFLDGNLDGSDDTATGEREKDGLAKIYIGARESQGGDVRFDGLIDEVRVWNRALSPEEINASYNTGLYGL